MQIKNISTLLIILLFSSSSLLNLYGQVKVLELKDPTTGTQDYKARDAVKMLPGFTYKALQGYTLTARVDETMVCDADYNNPASGQPFSRDFSTSLPVGSIAGAIDVSPTGAATYQIPIAVSPGTAGIQPSLSIVYNSQTGNGPLGMGWNIGGLSAILRVPQTIYHDGNVEGINLKNSDRFALDGNRLIALSGAYGGNGTVYATEQETFSRITSIGSAGNGPEQFRVETKDGSILEYGNTPDSRVEPNGTSTPLLWRLNRITDPNDNYMTFTYGEESGESYIKQIDYTGTASFQPYNTVKFLYSRRTDKNTSYEGGKELPQTVILRSIQMVCEGRVVKEYKFNYTYDFYTHLSEIVEYGSDGSHLNSTVINWGKTNSSTIYETKRQNIKPYYRYFGDFNGDGKTDILETGYNGMSPIWSLYVKTADNENGFTLSSSGDFSGDVGDIYVFDADGDGKDDVLTKVVEFNSTSQTWDWYYKFLSFNGTTFERGSENYDMHKYGLKMRYGDFNGDSKTEYMILYGSNKLYYISGLGLTPLPIIEDANSVDLIDFNGDGKTDIMIIKHEHCIVYSYNSLTSKFDVLYDNTAFPAKWNDHIAGYPDSRPTVYPGDFNGDGKTDLLFEDLDGKWKQCYSTGTSFSMSTIPCSFLFSTAYDYYEHNRLFIRDFNGDGKDDIIQMKGEWTDNYNIDCFYSHGDGSFVKDNRSRTNPDYVKYPTSSEENIALGDFNGDGKQDLLICNPLNYKYYLLNDDQSNLVQSIIDGKNQKTEITYKALTANDGFYAKGSGATFPVNDYKGAFYTVNTISTPNGVGGISTTSYTYSGAKVHRQGKGFLGFTTITTSNPTAGVNSVSTYEFDAQFYFPALKHRVVTTSSNSLISDVTYTNTTIDLGNKRYLPIVSHNVVIDGVKSITTTTDYTYDVFGNITYINSNITGVASSVTTNEYTSYTNKWGWGPANRLSKHTARITYSGKPSYERTEQYTFNSKGNITQKVSDPGKAKALTTIFTLNNIGLATATSTSDGSKSRSTSFGYDPKYRFVEVTTNALSHSATQKHDSGTGNVTEATDIDGNRSQYTYDGYGRLLATKTPQGYTILNAYNWSIGEGPNSRAYYVVSSSVPNRPTSKVYYDALGRIVRSQSPGFNGLVNVDREYDRMGMLISESLPYYDGASPTYTSRSYDDYGRLTSQTTDGRTTSTNYSSNTATTTHPDGKITTASFDALSNILTSVDKNGGIVTYVYGSHGKPLQITSVGTSITAEYDDYGRQTKLNDPNAGIVTYEYNGFGDLTAQSDANGNTSTMDYDCLGRLISKVTTEGTTNYAYVNSGKGIEQIESVSGANSTITYQYNQYGNATQVCEKILGVNYVTGYTYNDYGDVTSITYPSGFGVTRSYTNGLIAELKRTDTQASIWKRGSESAIGQPVTYSQGNNLFSTTYIYNTHNELTGIKAGTLQEFGYDFNHTTGNLNWRQDVKRNLTETFGYTDNLNRLNSISVQGQPQIDIIYGSNGNITSKTDVGSYAYNSTRINAVETVAGNPGTLPAMDINYTSFNKPSEISTGTYKLSLTYGVYNERVKTELYDNNVLKTTKIFVSNYEKETKNGITRELHYINGVYGLEAIYIKQGETGTMYYVLKDHLGSITALVNDAGSIAEEYSYDAWGRRRSPNSWLLSEAVTPNLIDRGFTGHEHLAEFGLINMNGRVYDQVLGRFLSPDNSVQQPSNTQSFNRYSYCLNNPLIYTDPSGYTWWSHFKGWVNNGFDNLGAWLNKNQITIQVGYNFQGGGGTPYVGAGSNGYNYNIGFNTSTGNWGIGPTNNGFTSFYYPNYNYGAPEQNVVNSINDARSLYSAEWNNHSIMGWKAEYDSYPQSQGGCYGCPPPLDPQGNLYNVQNYGGIKGLTVSYYKDDRSPGQAVIELSYTADGNNGAKWKQWCKDTNYSDMSSYSHWDGNNPPYYYTNADMAKHTNGNTVDFYDNPFRGSPGSYDFTLTLYQPGVGNLLQINWGLTRYSNGNTILSPLIVKKL